MDKVYCSEDEIGAWSSPDISRSSPTSSASDSRSSPVEAVTLTKDPAPATSIVTLDSDSSYEDKPQKGLETEICDALLSSVIRMALEDEGGSFYSASPSSVGLTDQGLSFSDRSLSTSLGSFPSGSLSRGALSDNESRSYLSPMPSSPPPTCVQGGLTDYEKTFLSPPSRNSPSFGKDVPTSDLSNGTLDDPTGYPMLKSPPGNNTTAMATNLTALAQLQSLPMYSRSFAPSFPPTFDPMARPMSNFDQQMLERAVRLAAFPATRPPPSRMQRNYGYNCGTFVGPPKNTISTGNGVMTSCRPSLTPPPNPQIGNLMQLRCYFGRPGHSNGKFNSPHGFCLDAKQNIIVADTLNHRIQVFNLEGQFMYQFGKEGKQDGQLYCPRKVGVLKLTGDIVVCDRGDERSRMQIFTSYGTFVRKIDISLIDIVAGVAITNDDEIAVVDSVSPTVFIFNSRGALLSVFHCSEYMLEPSDIAFFNGEFYICDFKGHCVTVLDSEGNLVRKIGSKQLTPFPNGIDVSDAGDVIIGDSHGNQFHVAIFGQTGQILAQFTCPAVKVSRCCGLQLTKEGYIITVAKNNNHVLVLNTLFLD